MTVKCDQCKKIDLNCSACHGLRFVLPIQNKIVSFSFPLSRPAIYNRLTWQSVRKIIEAILFAFVVIVFLTVTYFIYTYVQAGGNLFDFFFKKHPVLQVFWLAFFVSLYFYYRIMSDKVYKKEVIKKEDELKNTLEGVNNFTLFNTEDFKRLNAADSFTERSLRIMEKSYLLSLQLGQQLHSVHILYYLQKQKELRGYLSRLGIDPKIFDEKINNSFNLIEKGKGVSEESLQVFLSAYEEAFKGSRKYVAIEELFIAISGQESVAQEILFDLELDQNKVRNIVEWARLQKIISSSWSKMRARQSSKPKGNMNRSYTAVASPFLDSFSEDMTLLAKSGHLEPAVGKEKELESLFTYFNAGKSGVALVGKIGVGKSFVVESLAQLMAAETVPKIFQDKRLVRLSVPAMIAGASEPGAIEARLFAVLREVQRAGNIILAIDNIDTLVGLGTETSESLDLAETLSSELEKGYFHLVAVSDKGKYDKYLKKTSLGQKLAIVEVNEPDRNNAIRILEAKAPFLEHKYSVSFSYQSLEAAVDFSDQYMHRRNLPEKAIDVLERTATDVRQNKGETGIIVAEDIAKVVSALTKIPVTKVTEVESSKLLNLENEIHEYVVDQVEAVDMISQALRRSRANLRSKKRPIASFLFLGPTGVGKTEVAKTLSRIYFNGEEHMIRVDMSEYGSSDAIPKLIGMVGTSGEGYLTKKVKEQPFALVLLDEFEKADPEVHNLFLQVMEDGRLTDASGETTDFTNTIIIATSNAGTDLIHKRIKQGKKPQDIKEELVESELSSHFKPELLNRFDGVIVFKPLKPEEVEQIAALMLKSLAKNLAEKGIGFEYTQGALQEVAKLGFDPSFGARPLRRVIQDKIENQIANLILSSSVDRRDTLLLNQVGDVQVKKAVRI